MNKRSLLSCIIGLVWDPFWWWCSAPLCNGLFMKVYLVDCWFSVFTKKKSLPGFALAERRKKRMIQKAHKPGFTCAE